MKRFLSVRWIFTTLLVLAAMGVMVRLGFWQLDRLQQRRAFNSRVQAQLDQSGLELNAQALESGELPAELADMEYRQVTVYGEYDHTQQVVLRNQAWNNQLGVHLLTPLRIQGSEAVVLVDRGWIPYEDFTAGNLAKYDEPGLVRVEGMIRRSQSRPDFGRRADPTYTPGQPRLESLYMANVALVSEQTPYPLLPVYILQAPDAAWEGPPYRSLPELELTEGSHQSYAIQWFSFAAILGIGYPFFIRKEIGRREE